MRRGRIAPIKTSRTHELRCYTEFVLKRVTITMTDEVAKWVRLQAAEENTSVSQLVGRMLEEKMRQTDEYWAAFERLKN